MPAADPDHLSGHERAILAFEHGLWRSPAAKEQAIREEFAISATRYYLELDALIDQPAALAADPVLVQRLRRVREARRQRRSARLPRD